MPKIMLFKTMLLSLIMSVFTSSIEKDKIFITSVDPESGRILMIEEDDYSVWAYLLEPDKQGIDFEGFLCSVVDPKSLDVDPEEILKNGGAPPLSPNFSNKYSYIENLDKSDIRVYWKHNQVVIKIKKEIHLIMDIPNKTSYSKSVSKDGPYSKPLR